MYQRETNKYYNLNRDLSYGKFITAVVSSKNSGKTTSAKILAINSFLYGGHGTIWMRRDLNEMKGKNNLFIAQFFDRYIETLYKGHTFTGESTEHGSVFYIDGKPFLWAFAIKTCNKYGGNTLPIHIAYLIIDEFIPNWLLGQRELPNEAYLVHNFYSSITRPKNDARIILLGNPATDTSIYYDYFRMKESKNERTIGDEWIIHRDRTDYGNKDKTINTFETGYKKYMETGETLMAPPLIEKHGDYVVLFNLAWGDVVYTIGIIPDDRVYVCPFDGNKSVVVGSRLTNTLSIYYDVSRIMRSKPFSLFLILVRSNRITFSSPAVVGVRTELFRLASF